MLINFRFEKYLSAKAAGNVNTIYSKVDIQIWIYFEHILIIINYNHFWEVIQLKWQVVNKNAVHCDIPTLLGQYLPIYLWFYILYVSINVTEISICVSVCFSVCQSGCQSIIVSKLKKIQTWNLQVICIYSQQNQ